MRSVVMLGTEPTGKGGVASVVATYMAENLFARHQVRYLATHAEGSVGHKLSVALRALVSLVGLLLARRVALVHAHSASRGSFMRKSACLALARVFGVATVFHLHGAEFQKFADQEAPAWLRWWIRHTLRNSTVVVALSEAWRTYLDQLAPGARIEVVANPVSMPEAVQPEPDSALGVLFLGRADKRKGVFELIEAAALLRETVPGIQLLIGGDGDTKALQAHIDRFGVQAQVHLLGWVGPQDKWQLLQQAAVFCLPSHDEGLPMAMLEAMASGKAMVVTPVGGIPDAVQHGQHALLVPPGNAAALADALHRLLCNPQLRRQLGAAARQQVVARYAAPHVMAQLDAIYAELGAPSPIAATGGAR